MNFMEIENGLGDNSTIIYLEEFFFHIKVSWRDFKTVTFVIVSVFFKNVTFVIFRVLGSTLKMLCLYKKI